VLQTDRREYRGIMGHGLDRASASPWDVDENLRQQSSVEITQPESVPVASVLNVQQVMRPSLR
jgi:hypothetical protein